MSEKILRDVISSILGSCDGDFYELGGSSMDAIKIESALLEQGFVLSAGDIMQYPDIKAMVELMVPIDEIDWEM